MKKSVRKSRRHTRRTGRNSVRNKRNNYRKKTTRKKNTRKKTHRRHKKQMRGGAVPLPIGPASVPEVVRTLPMPRMYFGDRTAVAIGYHAIQDACKKRFESLTSDFNTRFSGLLDETSRMQQDLRKERAQIFRQAERQAELVRIEQDLSAPAFNTSMTDRTFDPPVPFTEEQVNATMAEGKLYDLFEQNLNCGLRRDQAPSEELGEILESNEQLISNYEEQVDRFALAEEEYEKAYQARMNFIQKQRKNTVAMKQAHQAALEFADELTGGITQMVKEEKHDMETDPESKQQIKADPALQQQLEADARLAQDIRDKLERRRSSRESRKVVQSDLSTGGGLMRSTMSRLVKQIVDKQNTGKHVSKVYLVKIPNKVGSWGIRANRLIKKYEAVSSYHVIVRKLEGATNEHALSHYAIEIPEYQGQDEILVGYPDLVASKVSGKSSSDGTPEKVYYLHVDRTALFANEPAKGERQNVCICSTPRDVASQQAARNGSKVTFTLVAVRDINEDEEILWCYGAEYENHRNYPTPCKGQTERDRSNRHLGDVEEKFKRSKESGGYPQAESQIMKRQKTTTE